MKSMRSHHKGSLRLAALLLLVLGGLMPGIAQTRYSANIVGYSDADFVAGSNLVANPFNTGNNTVSNLFAGLPSGSFFLPWDPLSGTFGPANEFTSQAGWTDGTAMLRRPEGAFLWLPAPKRITFVGQPWPPSCITYLPGVSLITFMPQYSCGLCAGVNDCLISPPEDTIVQKWDRQGQHWGVYHHLNAELGWYPDIVAPTLAPDEAAITFFPSPFTARYPGFYGPQPARLAGPSREGTNFTFRFLSVSAESYSVQRSFNLGTGPWRTILTETASPINGVITVTVPAESNEAAFYRLATLRLLNPSRAGSQFQFQFYAEEGVHYRVSRSPTLSPGQWNPVLNIDGTGALVTAIDPAATAATAYYRLEY
jgi:hypothetical protein